MTELDPADTVPVPRVLVEALREALSRYALTTGLNAVDRAARALVDAADSPPVDEALRSGGQLDKMDDPYANVRPAPSPSTREALPTDATPEERAEADADWDKWQSQGRFSDPFIKEALRIAFTAGWFMHKDAGPTREPVPTRLTDEERASLETWDREGVYACPHTHHCPTPKVCREKYGLFAEVERLLTARLSASTDRAEAWDECWNGVLDYLKSLNPVSESLAHNIRLVSKLKNPYRRNP